MYRERINPPTAEKIGLIGTHWSEGWVIEDNTIRYSISTCVTLGKHCDEFDAVTLPMFLDGNLYLKGALPSKHEPNPLVLFDIDPEIELSEKEDELHLHIYHDKAWLQQERSHVTTNKLGKVKEISSASIKSALILFLGNTKRGQYPHIQDHSSACVIFIRKRLLSFEIDQRCSVFP